MNKDNTAVREAAEKYYSQYCKENKLGSGMVLYAQHVIDMLAHWHQSHEGESELQTIIDRLKYLKPLHIMPYNLGDMGEISQLLDKLFKTASAAPAEYRDMKEGQKRHKYMACKFMEWYVSRENENQVEKFLGQVDVDENVIEQAYDYWLSNIYTPETSAATNQ